MIIIAILTFRKDWDNYEKMFNHWVGLAYTSGFLDVAGLKLTDSSSSRGVTLVVIFSMLFLLTFIAISAPARVKLVVYSGFGMAFSIVCYYLYLRGNRSGIEDHKFRARLLLALLEYTFFLSQIPRMYLLSSAPVAHDSPLIIEAWFRNIVTLVRRKVYVIDPNQSRLLQLERAFRRLEIKDFQLPH
ncbi:hypothetical protein ACFE04_029671 [Oxalis oulophora]